jgi:hypothetical protein
MSRSRITSARNLGGLLLHLPQRRASILLQSFSGLQQ